jgi:DNA-directed RNA polymerase beta' subunit
MLVDTTLRVIRSLCYFCARLCVRPEESINVRLGGKARMLAVANSARARQRCPHCGATRPQYCRSQAGVAIRWPATMAWVSDEERVACTAPFTARDALSILRNARDDDLRALGLEPRRSHPADMIMQVLLVPPPSTRPTIVASEGSKLRGQDDLSLKLQEIVRRCGDVRSCMGGSCWSTCDLSPQLLDKVGRLQHEVSVMITGSVRGRPGDAQASSGTDTATADAPAAAAAHADDGATGAAACVRRASGSSRRPASSVDQGAMTAAGDGVSDAVDSDLKKVDADVAAWPTAATGRSLVDRLKGKDGRIRSNLMGKRVDFSARCVISPGPALDLDQVGVPSAVALTLTVPETVCRANCARLTARVRVGAGALHGAETLLALDGTITELAHCADRHLLCVVPGCVVERYLEDDDVVVFNRQPSLHRMSMMGHRVLIVPGDTMRVNLSVTAPYNADFDGDEMNLHVPQSPAARASVASLMMVSNHILSPQASKPCIALVQDALLGVFLLSQPAELLSRAEASRLMTAVRRSGACAALPPPSVRARGVPRWTGKDLVATVLPGDVSVGRVREPWCAASWCGMVSALVVDGRILAGRLAKGAMGTSAGGLIDVVCHAHGMPRAQRLIQDAQRMAGAYLALRGFCVRLSDCVLSEDGQARVTERVRRAAQLVDDISCEAEQTDVCAGEKQIAEATTRRILSRTLVQTGGIVEASLRYDNCIRAMVLAGSKGSAINLAQIGGCVGQQSVDGQRILPQRGARTLPCFAARERSLHSGGFVSNSYITGLTPSEFFFHQIAGREGLVDTAVKTAATGYIQRRQTKSMEDHRVAADGTVQNGGGDVVQFSFGGAGWEPTKLERVRVATLRLTVSEVEERYPPALARPALAARTAVLAGCTPLTCRADSLERVALPVDYAQLVDDLARASPWRAAPWCTRRFAAVVDEVLRASDALPCGSPLLRFTLLAAFPTSACVALEAGAVRARLAQAADSVRLAQVASGEMVGCIAAQSVGEPTTQMSAVYETSVLVRYANRVQSVAIGKLVDALLPPVRAAGQHDVASVHGLRCVGVSPREQAAWACVTHVSRHPADGPLLTVTTAHGRTLTMTASHSFLIRHDDRVVPRRGSDLRVGDAVPIVGRLPDARHTDVIASRARFEADGDTECIPSPVPLSRATGAFLGTVLRNGGTSADGAYSLSAAGSSRVALSIAEAFYDETGISIRVQRVKGDGAHCTRTRITARCAVFGAWARRAFSLRRGRAGTTVWRLPAWLLEAPLHFLAGFLSTCFGTAEADAATRTETRTETCADGGDDGDDDRWSTRWQTERDASMAALCLARFGVHSAMTARDDGIRTTVAPWSRATFAARVGLAAHQSPLATPPPVPGVGVAVARHVRRSAASGHARCTEGHLDSVDCAALRAARTAATDIGDVDAVRRIDQALDADVWWDPIVRIESRSGDGRMVYDFTVDRALQSFMLSNGVFVHNTLNTFHYAGVATKNVTLGIPRLQELLSVSKTLKSPCLTLRLRPPFWGVRGVAEYVADTLPCTKLADIVAHWDVVQDDDTDADANLVRVSQLLDLPEPRRRSMRCVIRLQLDRSVMNTRRVTPADVRRVLQDRVLDRAHVIASELNDVEWLVRVRVCARLSSPGDEMASAHMCASSLLRMHLVGLASVACASVRCETCVASHAPTVHGGDGALELREDTEHVIDTGGVGLLACARLPVVDWARSQSNDLCEVIALLGIEAAAAVLYDELSSVISFDGTYVYPGHLLLIVDTMTRSGELLSLNRFGVNRATASPLARSSFEETPEMLSDAAVFAERDTLQSVSASVMTGRPSRVGTGIVDVRFDARQLPARLAAHVRGRARVCKSVVRAATHAPQPDLTEIAAVEPAGTADDLPDVPECERVARLMRTPAPDDASSHCVGAAFDAAHSSVALLLTSPPTTDDEL